tara:strand:- start:329 stop:1672 length:1344 start_codon:yes stop_codon:yes gene_type:complete
MKRKKVSIIIRTKNEERWISSCLKSVFSQEYKNIEVIIVDNKSTDKTIQIAKTFPIKKVLKIKNYFPGDALNLGAKNSKGYYIVCLSAHCIPTDNKWLTYLVNAIDKNSKCAGAYGRQEPMTFSSASDKRDLLIVFGLDKKIQKKDSFFHNANSIIRKNIWKRFPFSKSVTNIEDRLWAQKVLEVKYHIAYEPKASVYHYHGIHQNDEIKRLINVVNIIKKNSTNYRVGKINPENLKIAAIIPIRGTSMLINGKPLIKHTIEAAKESKFISDVFVSTDNNNTANTAKKLGAQCPFIRPKTLSDPGVNLSLVEKFTLNKIEKRGTIFDLIVHLEETFPFRSKNLIDEMIKFMLQHGYDSVIAVKKEPGWIWKENSGGLFKRMDSGDVPRKFKEKTFIGLKGVCSITYPEFIRKGNLLGKNIGFFETKNPLSSFEIKTKTFAKMFSKIL